MKGKIINIEQYSETYHILKNFPELCIVEIEPDENGRRFQIQEIPAPTEEELKEMRICEIQQRLVELDQDIVQDIAGEVVPNIEERKAEFVTLHNELRTLLGKEQRELKNTTNNLA